MSGTRRSIESVKADQALTLSLAAAIGTAGYFDADNAAMREVSAGLAGHIVERVGQDGPLRVGVNSHSVFVGSARVRVSLATFERVDFLVQVFDDNGINALTFHPGLTDAELATVAVLLARKTADGPGGINETLRRAGCTHIEVDLVSEGKGIETIAPVEAYAAAVDLGEKLREANQSSRHVNIRQVRHVTQAVVDQTLADPGSLLALTTIKEVDDHLIVHSANVAILSALLGERLGLSKTRLGELCMAGFLHDAGKLEVDPGALGKPGPLDPDEWAKVRKHPVLAARTLLNGRKLTSATMRAVVVAYEHHLNYDMSGYPVSQIRDHVSLFGNIVTIADRYDALTTARAYRRFSFSPHEVIGYLLYYAGSAFDPMLVKLFVQMMGLYPPGTLLRLNTGELGIVCQPPAAGTALDRPKIRVWTGAPGGEVVDLNDPAKSRGLEIAMVLSPAGLGQMPAIEPGLLEKITQEPPATS